MPFTPKFVDMVRNVTTVTGTGPVTLGAAVSGFTSLASAISSGEQFYYCIQGVDKPVEREVGRGTMQSDGKVARQAISGGLTSFTSGAKTIALVAPAEWYGKLDALSVGAMLSAATRTELASKAGARAYLSEAGRAGNFVFDLSNLTAMVSADPAQGIYVPPASDPTGASGAWVRRFEGAVNAKWFGAVGDNITNDGPAFVAAIAFLKTVATTGFGYSIGSPKLIVPAGAYYLGTTTLDLTHTLLFEGAGGPGTAGGPSTVLRWAAGTTGIRVQTHNTAGATGTKTSTPSERGDGSVIQGLYLKGAYSGTEADAHGIHLRGRASIRDCCIDNFQGDGIHVAATAGVGNPGEGNANNFEVTRVRTDFCRNGLFVDGADSNAGKVTLLDSNYNRQWGVWDSSFLGNSYDACHVATNAMVAGASTVVTHMGRRFGVVPGQEAGAAINAPPTSAANNIWWRYISDGGDGPGIVAWFNGVVVRAGGAYRTDNANARNVLTGCYSEGDQPASSFSAPTLLLGGLHAAGTANFGGHLEVHPGGSLRANGGLRVEGALDQVGSASFAGMLITNGPLYANSNLAVSGALTSAGNLTALGPTTGAATDNNIFIDNTNYNSWIVFRSWNGGAQQTDGLIRAARGWGLFLTGTASSPRVRIQPDGADLAEFYNGTFGYMTGAGGSVTQTTSKSTGVTLNKGSGQILTHDAGLAAGASASFTLTNNKIAATDVVIVNIGSGASPDSYAVSIDQLAAGSCRIQLRNHSGGTLSEALMLNFAVIKAVAA